MFKKTLISAAIVASVYTTQSFAKDYHCPPPAAMHIATEWNSGSVTQSIDVPGAALDGDNTISYYKTNGKMMCQYQSAHSNIRYIRHTDIEKNCEMKGGDDINCRMDTCKIVCSE